MQGESRIVSSLEKVFCNSNFTGERLSYLSALRGERVSFQIALCIDACAALEVEAVAPENFEGKFTFREVDLVPSLLPAVREDPYVLTVEPGLFPDPLKPFDKMSISDHNWHAVWVSVDIPKSATSGIFRLKFILKCTSRCAETSWCKEPYFFLDESIDFEIVNAVLPEQELKVAHWLYADCIQHCYHVPIWSEEHWSLLEKYFQNFAQHHNNMLLTPLWGYPLDIIPGKTTRPECQLLKISFDHGKWHFDFDRLVRWITTARRSGIKNFEMVHAFSQWGLHYAPEIKVGVDGREVSFFNEKTSSKSPEYREFLCALMKELLPVLRENGLNKGNCYFHISDEPALGDLENYRYASELFREILEDFPVIDALSNIEFFKHGLIERPIPAESELEGFLKENAAERWVYYAGEWRDGMPGRQFGMPSLRNRVLGILLYVCNCKGFLEWGYNYWFSQFNLTWDVDPWTDSNNGRSFRSGGAYLVYPGPDGPVDSLRHEVIADGFRDEMVLRALERKTSREAVLKFIDDETGYRISFKKYPRSEEWLLELRRKLNAKLAELC